MLYEVITFRDGSLVAEHHHVELLEIAHLEIEALEFESPAAAASLLQNEGFEPGDVLLYGRKLELFLGELDL